MEPLIKNFKENLNWHHSYILVGDPDLICKNLEIILKEDFPFGINLYKENYDRMLVEHASSIKNILFRTNPENEKTVYLIKTNFITVEAQNTLLKILEEPVINTCVIIVSKFGHSFLPTLKSRSMIVSLDSGENNLVDEVEKMIKLNYKDRLIWANKLIEKIKNHEESKALLVDYLNAIESVLYNRLNIKDKKIYSILWEAKNYSLDAGSSAKLLLEHVVLRI
jgi:hypothetical protein